ncbi:MAG: hypothetical protein QOG96_6549, partial [Pseudonocardiales bacterium]|nr:hypothetical protein [Pseudonocardiales bacterium]
QGPPGHDPGRRGRHPDGLSPTRDRSAPGRRRRCCRRRSALCGLVENALQAAVLQNQDPKAALTDAQNAANSQIADYNKSLGG